MDEKYKKCDENKHDRSNMYFPFNQSYSPTLLFIIGKKIIGVSLTTDYAQLYLLSTEIDPSKNNQLLYYCNCYGHHGLAKTSIQCVMHYWECPLTT